MTAGLIIITGASRGIGRRLCEMMAERGDEVIGVSRGASTFTHANYTHLQADVGDEASVVALFNSLRGRAPVRTVVNNAGASLLRPSILTTGKAFDDVLRINLVGAFLMSREGMKAMKRTKSGRIINITSISVPLATAGRVAYTASKAGLETLARTLSKEVGPNEDITINSVGISHTGTDGMSAELSEKAKSELTRQLSRPAALRTAEVLHALDFLASSLAANITGQTVYFGGPT